MACPRVVGAINAVSVFYFLWIYIKNYYAIHISNLIVFWNLNFY